MALGARPVPSLVGTDDYPAGSATHHRSQGLQVRSLLAAVITLSLLLVGCSGQDAPEDGGAAPTGGTSMEVVGTDGLSFEPEQVTVTAGEVTVELTAEPAVEHNVVIEGVAGDEPVVEAAAGETATGTVSLEAGSYTFYCSVPGHREAGMVGTIEVVSG